jgi:hypothetical protein
LKLTEKHHRIIHLLILDRGLRRDSGLVIAKQAGVTRLTLSKWRGDADFKEEFAKQLKLYRANFDDVPLADRKERVKALDGIFENLTDSQTGLKIKVLQAIRQEVGDDKQVLEVQHTGSIGIQAPPRAETYEEWVKQNEVMESSREVRSLPGVIEADFNKAS